MDFSDAPALTITSMLVDAKESAPAECAPRGARRCSPYCRTLILAEETTSSTGPKGYRGNAKGRYDPRQCWL